jgi:hypothetical protein
MFGDDSFSSQSNSSASVVAVVLAFIAKIPVLIAQAVRRASTF